MAAGKFFIIFMITDKTAAQAELLFNRLTKRYRHLKKWARRIGTNAFRLYDRDIPEIPLILDLYNDTVSGALYKRPFEKDEAEEENWLLAMRESAARALGLKMSCIFLKTRQRMRQRQEAGIQYDKISGKSVYRDVIEGDLSFRVNVSDYVDTGLFPDARKKRAVIRSEAAGKSVLNLFAYTCSLSVCAAKGGAFQVDSVDLSNTYLDWGKVNFVLNGLNEGLGEQDKFGFIREDVSQFISHAARKGKRWDLIILDPPSFSNSKKMKGTLDIRRDHRELIQRCLSILSPKGTLYFSSNAKGFRLDDTDFPSYKIREITEKLRDEDFLGKKIPACYVFEE